MKCTAMIFSAVVLGVPMSCQAQTTPSVSDSSNFQVVRLLEPAEALEWDYYVEVVPLREGVVLDTKAARGQNLIHSSRITEIAGRQMLVVLSMRPKAGK